MGRKNKLTAEQIVVAVKGSGGFVTEIAKRLDCSRQTIYNYRKRYATVETAIWDEKENMLDIAENELMRQIKGGNMTGIIFYLKTQGKQRGYVERQEFAGVDGGPLKVEYVNDWRSAKD